MKVSAVKPLVSVVIPFYNAAVYLPRCLENLQNQTLKEIEYLFVDDGSTDEGATFIEHCRNEQIKLIRLPHNSGQSIARNRGIAAASGEYIGFIDADDKIDNAYFEQLYQTAVKNQADIAMAATVMYHGNKPAMMIPQQPKAEDFTDKMSLLPHGAVWDKIFKAELLQKHQLDFFPQRIWEDSLFNLQALFYANKICTKPSVAYHYYLNEGSSLNNRGKQKKKREDNLFIAKKMLEFAHAHLPEKDIGIVENFISKKMFLDQLLLNRSFRQQACKILPRDTDLQRRCRKFAKKSLFSFSLKKKRLMLCGFNLWK